MKQKKIITMEKSLRCEYLMSSCQRKTTKALIWKHNLIPNRWIMMPVCSNCFMAAMTMYEMEVSNDHNN